MKAVEKNKKNNVGDGNSMSLLQSDALDNI
jgi:hypothetical protein